MNLNSKPLFIRTRIQDAPLQIVIIDKLSREIEEHLLTAHHLLRSPTEANVKSAEHHRKLAEFAQEIRDRALAMRN